MTDQKDLIQKRLDFIAGQKSDFWAALNEKKIVELFKYSSQHISAYQAFLKKAQIQPDGIVSLKEMDAVPAVSKKNYLRSYPWNELMAQDALTKESLVLTSTSGSTGEPFYFPRNSALDDQSSVYHQLFVKNSQIDPRRSTLVIVCFGMGVWIGGVITYQAFKSISGRGYPLTIITPGVNKKEIFAALKNMAPQYDQVILCGYPPFVKDVVDEAPANGIDWKKLDLKIVFAAEAFSEKFRDYIMKKTGMKNPYRDTMNIYGSADLGTMATESPIAILVRRLALKNTKQSKAIYKKLFGEATRLPTLAQYIPDFIQFECINKSVYLSGDNVLPLVRYEIGDNGGLLTFSEIEAIFRAGNIDLRAEAKKIGIEDTITELPFVYIYERTDFSTKLYGAIIYPEYIKDAVYHPRLQKHITGKFSIATHHDEKQDEYLQVNIELKPNIDKSKLLEKEVLRRVTDSLLKKSAEHRNNFNMMGDKVKPRIVFWEHEHPVHFKTGIKQKWVQKQSGKPSMLT